MRNTYTQPYTRPKYTSYQTTYSAPGTGNIDANGSVTLNYTSRTTETGLHTAYVDVILKNIRNY